MSVSNAKRIMSIASTAMLFSSIAFAQSLQPHNFPDVRELEFDWTLSVPEDRDDGFQYNTRIAFKPLGGVPVKAWQIEVECEKTDTRTRHFSLVNDKGTAKLAGGQIEMKAGKIGKGTMLLKKPMTVRFAEKKCGVGSPWIAPAERPQSNLR